MQNSLFEVTEKKNKVKPFLKWVGGKTQLLPIISEYLPNEIKVTQEIKSYIEPFIGGGAVFFYLMSNYDIHQATISDTNKVLIDAYLTIRDNIDLLLDQLSKIEKSYLSKTDENRKIQYYLIRTKFNELIQNRNDFLRQTAFFIFLNRTCFNGLYRVNSKGLFNVPIGSYKKPKICNESNLMNISNLLSDVNILYSDFESTSDYIDENSFVYFDPPYRPINKTSSFNSYVKDSFGDKEQIRLANYFKFLNEKGALLMLSNSDPQNFDCTDDFFDKLYSQFKIYRVEASRMINSIGSKRGKIKEVLITNY